MVVRIRVRCPCCGSLPELERVKGLGEVEVQVFRQTFGGRVPRDKAEGYSKKRGTAGIMKYEDVTAEEPELVEEVKALWRKRLKVARSTLK